MKNCIRMLTACKDYCLHLRNVIIILVLIFVIVNFGDKATQKKINLNDFPEAARKFLMNDVPDYAEHLTSEQIRELIKEHNFKEQIQNADNFGPLKSDTIILVINVHSHRFTKALRYLIVSLSQVRGIEDTLLIFSHCKYDMNINKLILSIDFCRVLQIFYPYSIQTHPYQFPGFTVGDCEHNMPVAVAESSNCTGAFTPDIHGHYRLPLLTELKHHWWWTANKVFENLTCTEKHEGLVIFIDPNTFVMEDLVFMILNMKKKAESVPQCDFFTLGTTNFPIKFTHEDSYAFEVRISSLNPNLHSNILGFDLSTWNSISAHYDIFCNFDDYSWSQSLYYISLNRRDNRRYVEMSTALPRAYPSLPDWSSWSVVELEESIYDILELQKRFKELLFPSHLEIRSNKEVEEEDPIFDHTQKKGGWSDPRDRQLCSDMTIGKIKKVLLDMKNEFSDFTSAPISTP